MRSDYLVAISNVGIVEGQVEDNTIFLGARYDLTLEEAAEHYEMLVRMIQEKGGITLNRETGELALANQVELACGEGDTYETLRTFTADLL